MHIMKTNISYPPYLNISHNLHFYQEEGLNLCFCTFEFLNQKNNYSFLFEGWLNQRKQPSLKYRFFSVMILLSVTSVACQWRSKNSFQRLFGNNDVTRSWIGGFEMFYCVQRYALSYISCSKCHLTIWQYVLHAFHSWNGTMNSHKFWCPDEIRYSSFDLTPTFG